MTNATNGLGWEIQQYESGSGWMAFTVPLATRAEAEQALADCQSNPGQELRVYESLPPRVLACHKPHSPMEAWMGQFGMAL